MIPVQRWTLPRSFYVMGATPETIELVQASDYDALAEQLATLEARIAQDQGLAGKINNLTEQLATLKREA